MSREGVDVVRRIYELAPDVERLLQGGGRLTDHPWLALWHPECVLEDIAEVPGAAAYRGRDGVARYFERAYNEVWDQWNFTPVEEIVEGGDGVFAAVDSRGRSKAGAQLTLRIFQVFRLRDGMIVYATGYLDRDQALAAAGLAE